MSRCDFHAVIQKFQDKGDKTNWTYLVVPAQVAGLLNPGNKKSFRVTGKLDHYVLTCVALIPAGEGNYLLPLNASMRKELKKQVGATIRVIIEAEREPPLHEPDLIQCLQDDPVAWSHFCTLTPSHQRYFSNWVGAAKTTITRDKRIASSVTALAKKWDYGMMIRSLKKET